MQLNFNVAGPHGDDKPYIRTDQNFTTNGYFEGNNRFIVILPEDLTGGATLHYQRGQKSVRVILPPGDGIWEAGEPPCQPPEDPPVQMVYSALLESLHAEGVEFKTQSGRRWVMAGHIDFVLRKRFMENGPDTVTGILTPRLALGSNSAMTLEMWYYGEKFKPSDYGEKYYADIKPFARHLASLGAYWQPIILADAHILMPSIVDQRNHVGRFAREIAGEPNVLPILVNEFQKNGVDPNMHQKPEGTGCLWSKGSGTSDGPPPQPGWDWHQWHGRRDFKALFSSQDGYYVMMGHEEGGPQMETPKPCGHTEPIGFWSNNVSNRRSNDPNLARIIAATSVLYMQGANFMSEEGLRCGPWEPRTQECARAFYKGLLV